MFLHLSVILFTEGGLPGQAPSQTGTPPGRYTPRQVHSLGRYTPPGRYTPRQVHPLDRYTPQAGTPPRQLHLPGRYTPQAGSPLGRYSPGRYIPLEQVHPLSHSACWDTVNKWVVRIPLECILVYKSYSKILNSRRMVPMVITKCSVYSNLCSTLT